MERLSVFLILLMMESMEVNILSCGMQKKIWLNPIFFSTGGEIILSKATISVNNIIIEEDFSKNGNRIKKVKKNL